ncbi:hypothetical protein SCB49_04685 [unidentified eubacterium SCB49]|nr:hypothetical protein SCB49_04685 [unidentified eubacterium SCB49]
MKLKKSLNSSLFFNNTKSQRYISFFTSQFQKTYKASFHFTIFSITRIFFERCKN